MTGDACNHGVTSTCELSLSSGGKCALIHQKKGGDDAFLISLHFYFLVNEFLITVGAFPLLHYKPSPSILLMLSEGQEFSAKQRLLISVPRCSGPQLKRCLVWVELGLGGNPSTCVPGSYCRPLARTPSGLLSRTSMWLLPVTSPHDPVCSSSHDCRRVPRARSLETAGSRLCLRASEIAQYPFCRSHKPTCLQEVRTQLLPFEGRGGSEKPCSETLRWHGCYCHRYLWKRSRVS